MQSTLAAALAAHLNDAELRKLAEAVLRQLQAKGIKPDTAVIYIQLLGSVRCCVSLASRCAVPPECLPGDH